MEMHLHPAMLVDVNLLPRRPGHDRRLLTNDERLSDLTFRAILLGSGNGRETAVKRIRPIV